MPSSVLRATCDGMGEWPDGLRFSFSDREQEKKFRLSNAGAAKSFGRFWFYAKKRYLCFR